MRKTSGVATVSGRSVSGTGARNLPPGRERYPGATPEERRLLNANQRSFCPGSSGTKSLGEVVTRAAFFARICISHGAVRIDAPISRVQTQPFSWIGKQYGVYREQCCSKGSDRFQQLWASDAQYRWEIGENIDERRMKAIGLRTRIPASFFHWSFPER